MSSVRTVLGVLLLVLPLSLCGQSQADLLLQKGLALAKEHKWNEAQAALRDGQIQFPRDSRFPIELAGLAYREKNESAAKKDLRRALLVAPRDAYANDFLGTLYFDDRNLAAALGPWNRIDKPFLGQIVFSPVPPLQTLLRERAVPLSPGQLLTPERLRMVQDNLERLGSLADFDLELIPHQGQDDKYDLLVRSLPIGAPLSGWAARLLPLARELPYQAVAADFLNLGHEAINVRTLWRWDPNKRKLSASLQAPWHANPRIEQDYRFDLRDETWLIPGVGPPLLLRIGALTGGFTFTLRPQLHWSIDGRLEDRTYARAPDQPSFRNGFSAAIDNRLMSDWLLARLRLAGHEFATLSAARFAGSRLITTRGGGFAHWMPGARQDRYELTAQMQAGQTFGPAPLDEQFSLAMERDTEDDLWLRGIVGTTNGQKGAGPIGRSYAVAQTDVQRKIFEIPFVRVSAGPYFDAGSVGQAVSSARYRGIQYDTGVEAKARTMGSVDVFLIYGLDLRSGGGVFYTAVSRTLK